MFRNRRDEYLDFRPSANPLLDALAQRIRVLTPDLVVQPAAGSPWTAYYLRSKLVALARPAPDGVAGAIEYALPVIGVAGTASEAQDLDEPVFEHSLKLAVQLAPSSVSAGVAGMSGFDVVDLIDAALTTVVRDRAERRAAERTGTQHDLEILRAAREEANRRGSSLTIGCLLATVVGIATVFVVSTAAARLLAFGVPEWLAAIAWLPILLVPWYVFRRIRRRYPGAPLRQIDRLGRSLIIVVVVMLAGLAIYGLLGGGGTRDIAQERVAWCLGPGKDYVDNAVRVLSIQRTWTAGNEAADPHFRLACDTAWEATHP